MLAKLPNNYLFTNKLLGEGGGGFDFVDGGGGVTVGSTQNLHIIITIPKGKKHYSMYFTVYTLYKLYTYSQVSDKILTLLSGACQPTLLAF